MQLESFINTIYGGNGPKHCKDNHLLNEGSYGRQPGRRSIDPVIIDVTQVEIAMIT